jgi:hypothetical protein
MKVLQDRISFYFEDLKSVLDKENSNLVDDFIKFSTDMVVKAYSQGFPLYCYLLL